MSVREAVTRRLHCEPLPWWPSLRSHVYVLAGYTLLTALFTYPMILQLRSHLIGMGNRDVWQYYWNLWWVKKALLELHTNPFYTQYLYHPTGASLYFHNMAFFDGVLAIPVQALFGLPFAYNFIVFFSFLFGGYGTFLLVDYLVGNKAVAFISGIIFAFSPYHAAEAHAHLSLVSSEWIPFYVLFCIKALGEENTKAAILTSLSMLLCFLCDLYYALYVSLFTVMAAIYYLWRDRNFGKAKRLLLRLSLIVILFGILSAPVLVPMLKEASTSNYATPPPSDTVRFSADLLDFFRPNTLHPLRSEPRIAFADFEAGILAAPRTISLGYTVMALAGLGAFKCQRQGRFWSAVLLLFFVMALGPILHVNGRTQFTPFSVSFPLPYILLYQFPLVQIGRAPARMAVMVMLALAVLTGLGLAWLLQKMRDKTLAGSFSLPVACTILAGGLIGFEFLAIPFPLKRVPSAPSFDEALFEDQADYAILDVPPSGIQDPGLIGRYMFYQTIHGKAIFGGYTARKPRYPLADMPVFQKLTDLSPDMLEPDIVDPTANALELAYMFGFKYVVVHRYLILDPHDLANLLQYLENPSPYYSDEEVLVFQTEQASFPIVGVDQHWYPVQRTLDGTVLFRWMATPATLKIIAPSSTTVQLELTIFRPWFSKTLEIYLNEQFVGSYPTRPEPKNTVLLEVEKGENIVRLVCPEGNFIPAEVDPRSKDTRPQIISFREIKLLPLSQ